MRPIACLLVLSMLPCTWARADQEKVRATEDQVIASTQQLAAKDCTPPKNSNGLRISGCQFSAEFQQNKWAVRVKTIFITRDGTPNASLGNDSLYLFTEEGAFVERVAAM